MIPTLPALLPANVLNLRMQLPLKPAVVTLTGRFVRLEPYDAERDSAALHAVSNGQPCALGERQVAAYDAEALIWRFLFAGPFATLADFQAYMQRQVDAPNGLPFTAFDPATNQPIGVINYLNNSPADLKIELGSIWYSPLVQRSGVNTEATYLLLRHAFGLGYRRLEWKCNSLNERSRQTALRMGFQFEGLQEQHMIVKNRSRDTAWYRILAHEWPQVESHLQKLLYG